MKVGFCWGRGDYIWYIFFYVWLSCYSEKDELEKYQYDWICFVPTKHGYSKMDFKNSLQSRYLFELIVIINWGRLDISVENVVWNCSWSLYFSEVVEIFFVQILMEGTWFEITENGSLIGTGHFRFLTS